jgi:DtxR family Mn-dependent transcriptional regulator
MDSTDPAPPAIAESAPSVTPKMEDYLRRIYRLQQESESRVSNSDLADSLDISRASVTSMLDTLSEQGLIDRERYRPVRLSDAGETRALQVVRRHRLAETMLAEMFSYRISEVDAEADILEHYLSPRLCRAIERELGMPEVDPHGDPIPDSNLDVSRTADETSLLEVAESSTVEVTRLLTHDDETLEYLVSTGIEPGACLHLDETTPIGMVSVSTDATASPTSLPQRVASQILVESFDE